MVIIALNIDLYFGLLVVLFYREAPVDKLEIARMGKPICVCYTLEFKLRRISLNDRGLRFNIQNSKRAGILHMNAIHRLRDVLSRTLSSPEISNEQELFDQLMVQKSSLLKLFEVGPRNPQEQNEIASGQLIVQVPGNVLIHNIIHRETCPQ